jgi:recombination protein RecR
MKLPLPIQRVADELAELPSIGPRQAIRLAFYIVGQNKEAVRNLAAAVDNLRNIKICERCFFIHQNEPAVNAAGVSENLCDICRNPNRNQRAIMVVEKETDLVSLENTGKYTGRYFIIGEITKTGILEDWQKQRVQALKSFIEKNLGTGDPAQTAAGQAGKADEIIFAFNPTSLGDLQTSLLVKELGQLAKKNSRLGRGLPTGGEIEFADDETLSSALDRRS